MLFQADPSDLVFYLGEAKEQDEEDPARYDLRRRYWAQALPEIQEAFQTINVDCFSNVNPTKMNWSSGSVGYSGITVTCVGNLSELQVQLYIGTSDAVKNKEIFDYLYSRKDVIEHAGLSRLIWDRGDEKKAAKIYSVENQLGIQNEQDWPHAVEWHWRNSLEIYQAFKPALDAFFGL